jgi:hypothetical protein
MPDELSCPGERQFAKRVSTRTPKTRLGQRRSWPIGVGSVANEWLAMLARLGARGDRLPESISTPGGARNRALAATSAIARVPRTDTGWARIPRKNAGWAESVDES